METVQLKYGCSFVGKESQRHYGRAQEVYRSGQSRCSEGGWLASRHKIFLRAVEPRSTADFPGAVIREGTDEVTLRAHEEGVLRSFIDTAKVEDQKWEPPPVDADWHSFCQAIWTRVGSHVLPL